MGAFIGYGDVGVWANNRERNAFLDWFADNRCVLGDKRWEFCKSEGHRWNGFCFDLKEIMSQNEKLGLTLEERDKAAKDHWDNVAQLLEIIDAITCGEWQHRVDSHAAIDWRRDNYSE